METYTYKQLKNSLALKTEVKQKSARHMHKIRIILNQNIVMNIMNTIVIQTAKVELVLNFL